MDTDIRTMTPRAQLRAALTAQWSMNLAEHYWRLGIISEAAFDRFERLWAITTATEHRRTAWMTFEHWKASSARARRAVVAFVAAHA